jgi:hypothetical protein
MLYVFRDVRMKNSRSSGVGRGQFFYTRNWRAVRGFPSRRHASHMGLECGLEGWNQVLKLVKRHAREIQELHGARLQLGKP